MMLLEEIAGEFELEIAWPNNTENKNIPIDGVSPIQNAVEGSITFIADHKYLGLLDSCKASALITQKWIPSCPIPQLLHDDPHFAFAKIAGRLIFVDHGPKGINKRAFIHDDAVIGDDVTIYPFAVVDRGANIGHGVVLYPGVSVGADATVGDHSVIYANAVVGARCHVGRHNIIHSNSVLGADGFGFRANKKEIVKIPHVGTVRTQDHVELGACCTIDRATMGETLVKSGTKFDDHVHVGHNSIIGKNCMFAGSSVVAGSSEVGDWCMTGGQAAIGGHIKIGDRVQLGAKSGTIKDVSSGQVHMGFPSQPAMSWRRNKAGEKKLPEMLKKMKSLEERLARLEAMGLGKDSIH